MKEQLETWMPEILSDVGGLLSFDFDEKAQWFEWLCRKILVFLKPRPKPDMTVFRKMVWDFVLPEIEKYVDQHKDAERRSELLKVFKKHQHHLRELKCNDVVRSFKGSRFEFYCNMQATEGLEWFDGLVCELEYFDETAAILEERILAPWRAAKAEAEVKAEEETGAQQPALKRRRRARR